MILVVTVNHHGTDIVCISKPTCDGACIVESHPMLPVYSSPDENTMNLFEIRDKDGLLLPDCVYTGSSISLSENMFNKGYGWKLWINGVVAVDFDTLNLSFQNPKTKGVELEDLPF